MVGTTSSGGPLVAHTWHCASPQRSRFVVASASCCSALQCPCCPKGKDNRKLAKASLETHQECHHFEVSNNLPATLIILQGRCCHRVLFRSCPDKLARYIANASGECLQLLDAISDKIR
ncbi:uncharacterized protein LOC143244588 [Tachypleus tridentatus]|uniref:uncharacterized protein LOC143244588 n=1 Tax=Tachypleus tridentatus TaxID=6853 RepID=UPI003FD403B8